MTTHPSSSSSPPQTAFHATRWSVVLAARGGSPSAARRALGELIQAYWYPLYAFVRRRGQSAAEAEDLTQEFFTRLLERHDLASVDPAKGRFRSFLLASLKHFLANEWDRRHALKRGGRRQALSLDTLDAETRYGLELADELTPEKLFERKWALTVLDQVLVRLKGEYAAAGKAALFDALKGFLTGLASEASQAQIAVNLGLTPNAVRVAVHRLRKRYRHLLREEISQTVATPADVDEEIRFLLGCL